MPGHGVNVTHVMLAPHVVALAEMSRSRKRHRCFDISFKLQAMEVAENKSKEAAARDMRPL